MSSNVGTVCAVVLNYNGWEDTVECLDSLFACEDPSLRVIVCDNGSVDGSIEHILDWARGKKVWKRPAISPLGENNARAFTPIQHRLARRGEAGIENWVEPLLIIDNQANLGFAGGCNPALQLITRLSDIAYIWLLNNDTVVAPGAHTALVHHLQTHPQVSMSGSIVLEYYRPGEVQALGGGRLHAWCAAAGALGQGMAWPPVEPKELPKLDYVTGCAVFLGWDTLKKLGFLDESFFLYYEDLDWSRRAQQLGPIDCCGESLVFHKEGRSIGSSSRPKEKVRSRLSDYHSFRSRVIFAHKHHPGFLPLVAVSMLVVAFRRIRRGQWNRLGAIARVLLGCFFPSRLPGAVVSDKAVIRNKK